MEVTSGPSGPNNTNGNGQASWRDSVSVEERRAVISHLLRNFQSKPTYAPSDQEKLYRLVARIEEKLWQASRSKEEYLDPQTMSARIRQLLQASQGQSQQGAVGNGAQAAAQAQQQAQQPAQAQSPAQPQVQQPQPQQQQPQQQLQQQYLAFSAGLPPPASAGPSIIVKKERDAYTGAQAAPAAYPYQQLGGYAAPGGVNTLPQLAGQAPAGAAAAVPGQVGYDPMAALLNGGGAAVGAAGAPVPGAVAGAPAGMSTAESGLQGNFMSNGAPVLVRGGGGAGGAAAAGLAGLPGGLGTMPTGMAMPQIKLEPTGGMIPVNSGVQAQQPSQQQIPLAQEPAQQLPTGMMPVQASGGAGPGTMVPAPGTEAFNRPSTSLDDIFGGAGGDFVGGDFGSEGAGLGGALSPSASKQESRKQQILKQQRWLLFLRHCARCNLQESECPYGVNCTVAKQLWSHLIGCKSPACTYPRCSPSRELLKHHQRCKSPQCPVCAPVKQYVAKQREAILQRKLDASGLTREEQARYLAHMQARRAALVASAQATTSAGGGAATSSQWGAQPIVDPQAVKRPRLVLQENMGTSLIEYFTEEEIRTHIQNIHTDSHTETSGARRSAAMMSNLDDFGAGLQEEESCCKVCHRNKLVFEPPLLYCYGCGQRIKRNQTYYATPKHSEIRGLWCHPCMQNTPGECMQLESFSIRKQDMEKRRNDDEQEEAWVQCDFCEGWVHQICGLFNKGRNNEERGFLCPHCLLTGLERHQRTVSTERPQAMLTAKDLPRCDLSDFIEARLQRAVQAERAARAASTGRSVDEIRGGEGLVVRVVNNVVKKMEVKARFAEAFCGPGSPYPEAASYKQKVILLFQHQDGVDMCLYCLYLQEYGDDCAPPNNRVVHLSYLDSVKYFQPEKVSAAGFNVALRTMVYHEVLLAYIQHAKARGYCAIYIWACPPISGDDYIMYCHPGKQKMPRSDRLREWYLTMLRRGKAEGTVSYISNLYDTYFEGGKDHRIERPSVLEMPYLDGDYWPGEAENLLANLNGPDAGADTSKAGQKGRKNAKDKRWRPNPDATPAEQLLGRLGEAIQGMREDFIVAHLYENCSYCRKYIDDDMRYYHPNPPQKVTFKSERTFDGIALDRPGGDASRTVSLTRFQLCQHCYSREAGRDPMEKPLGLPAGIALTDLVAEPCPKLPPTTDSVPQIDNEFFDTRNQFLSLCQGNHYQFDTTRRARHSSMMVLYHLHNPSEPAFTVTCNVCQAELKAGEGYRCLQCADFDMCAKCHASPAVTHPHPLVPQSTRKFDETRMRLTDEDRMRRDQSLQRTMALLVHASACSRQDCPSTNCAKVKALFNHAVSCGVKITGGCTYCRRMWALLQAHSKMCIAAECPVPRCRELRQLRRKQAARQEDMRRAAYRKMLLQQQAVTGQGKDAGAA